MRLFNSIRDTKPDDEEVKQPLNQTEAPTVEETTESKEAAENTSTPDYEQQREGPIQEEITDQESQNLANETEKENCTLFATGERSCTEQMKDFHQEIRSETRKAKESGVQAGTVSEETVEATNVVTGGEAKEAAIPGDGAHHQDETKPESEWELIVKGAKGVTAAESGIEAIPGVSELPQGIGTEAQVREREGQVETVPGEAVEEVNVVTSRESEETTIPRDGGQHQGYTNEGLDEAPSDSKSEAKVEEVEEEATTEPEVRTIPTVGEPERGKEVDGQSKGEESGLAEEGLIDVGEESKASTVIETQWQEPLKVAPGASVIDDVTATRKEEDEGDKEEHQEATKEGVDEAEPEAECEGTREEVKEGATAEPEVEAIPGVDELHNEELKASAIDDLTATQRDEDKKEEVKSKEDEVLLTEEPVSAVKLDPSEANGENAREVQATGKEQPNHLEEDQTLLDMQEVKEVDTTGQDKEGHLEVCAEEVSDNQHLMEDTQGSTDGARDMEVKESTPTVVEETSETQSGTATTEQVSNQLEEQRVSQPEDQTAPRDESAKHGSQEVITSLTHELPEEPPCEEHSTSSAEVYSTPPSESADDEGREGIQAGPTTHDAEGSEKHREGESYEAKPVEEVSSKVETSCLHLNPLDQ